MHTNKIPLAQAFGAFEKKFGMSLTFAEFGRRQLCFVGARSTRLEFAVRALKDVPVRTRVAEIAMPEDEGRVALDHLECVVASPRHSHVGALRKKNFDD
jgi:hypothetical protein